MEPNAYILPLFIFSTYLLRSFVALFWGIFLFFYQNQSRQNLPLSCIFLIIGVVYLINSYTRFPLLEACDVYNVNSFLILTFIAPFTIFYAYFALKEKHEIWHYLLHFIPFICLTALWIVLQASDIPRIPFCYSIEDLFRYISGYSLYAAFFFILVTIFTIQVITYFSMALKRLLRIKKAYRDYSIPCKPVNCLLAMDFLFLCYPLFCIFFLMYNNNPALGVIHNIFVSIVITTLSILNLQLILPIKTDFSFMKRKTTGKESILSSGKSEAAIAAHSGNSMAEQIRILFEEEEMYKIPQFCMQDIVNKLCTNRTYVSNCINNHYACSFKQLLAKYRIESAKELLKKTDRDVQDIAWDVGFNTRAAFYYAFKEVIGEDISPVEWRKKHSEKTEIR